MNSLDLKYCPSTLAEGFDTYSPSALRNMFFGKKVSHILDFYPPDIDENIAEKFRQNSKTLSISGAQFKQSLVLEKNKLRLAQSGERGQYILKPIPLNPGFGKSEELPANEHVTMQIAKQAYGMRTAECALIFFRNGDPAYITRRFDYKRNGQKIAQEDFASLSGLARAKDGEQYKYQGSYEALAKQMRRYVVAYAIDVENYFERILFNYLFSNGDAHLKNFSLSQTSSGDYILSPAYDMVDTRIHTPQDSFFALRDGLFTGDYATDSFKANGFYAYDDFYEFGKRIGLKENRVKVILDKYRSENDEATRLVKRSFLGEQAKAAYISHYSDRIKMLGNSYSGKI